MKVILSVIINAIAIYVSVLVLNGRGLAMTDMNWVTFALLGLIFGVVNAFLKPIITVLGCPIYILTLGLGFLLINTLLFYITSLLAQAVQIDFSVTSFWGAFFGALIVSLVSLVLGAVLRNR